MKINVKNRTEDRLPFHAVLLSERYANNRLTVHREMHGGRILPLAVFGEHREAALVSLLDVDDVQVVILSVSADLEV